MRCHDNIITIIVACIHCGTTLILHQDEVQCPLVLQGAVQVDWDAWCVLSLQLIPCKKQVSCLKAFSPSKGERKRILLTMNLKASLSNDSGQYFCHVDVLVSDS